MSQDQEVEITIDPKFQDVYAWELTPTGPYIVLTIHYPAEFDPKKVEMKLNDAKNAIWVHYPGQPAIVEGQLFNTIKDAEMKINEEEKQITITFTLLNDETPSMIITDFHPETHMLDPLSSYLIFSERAHSPSDALKDGCFKYLEFGLNANFIPAMLTAAGIFQHIPQLADKAIELFVIAADRYNAPPAQFQLGLFLMRNPKLKERAFDYIERAASDPQLTIASIVLGIMLSPIADMESPKKDAKRAAEIFENVLKIERHPLALHELAMLYFNGIGVEKDVEKAKALNEEAGKDADGQVPPLEERDESYVPQPVMEDCACGCCHCHDAPAPEEHGCGCCHHEHEHAHEHGCGCCHDEHEHAHEHDCGCCHEGEKKEGCCGGKCDGKGGCGGGKCDGKGGCGGHCHCHDHQ